MKKLFFILLLIYVINAISSEKSGWLNTYHERIGINPVDQNMHLSAKAKQKETTSQIEYKSIMGSVIVPAATFVTAATVFTLYKNLP